MSGTARGRPRDPDVDGAILAAASGLYAEAGYEGVTMSGIAARAGVGKQSVYRRWPGKADVIAECVAIGLIDLTPVIPRASGDVRADLVAWMRTSYRRLGAPGEVELFRALNVAAVSNDALARRVGDILTGPLRAGIRRSIQAGSTAAPAVSAKSVDAAVDLLVARMLYAVVTGETRTPDEIEDTVDLVLSGIPA